MIKQSDKDDLAAYLAGQQPFLAEKADEHRCQRCKRACKPRFTHCYRCYQYLQVKNKLAEEAHD